MVLVDGDNVVVVVVLVLVGALVVVVLVVVLVLVLALVVFDAVEVDSGVSLCDEIVYAHSRHNNSMPMNFMLIM